MIPEIPCPIILASRSPRRIELLQKAGFSFRVEPAAISEPRPQPGEAPIDYARDLALKKAQAIGKRNSEALVIGADTIVVVDNQILGKPESTEDAFRMLGLLSNRWHSVTTAYCMVRECEKFKFISEETTKVHFRELLVPEIEHYIATGGPFDKAGGYGIQDYSAIFVDAIEGCFYNVVGLPLTHFVESLKIVSRQICRA